MRTTDIQRKEKLNMKSGKLIRTTGWYR